MRVFAALLVAVLLVACDEAGTGGQPNQPGTEAPTASPVSTVNFKPIKLSGKGSKVPKFKIPANVAAIATITNKGSSNFAVTAIGADGSEIDLLVNEIGSYGGTVLFDTGADEHSVAFKVQSSGTWTITIKPISAARAWKPTGRLTGKGDDVVRVVPPISGFATATITNKSTSNFAVTTYTADGSADLLVNEIGNYSGESTLPNGTFVIQVQAVGGIWAVTPS